MESLEEEFGFEQIDPVTVYRTLRQMENEGLCKSEWETFEHDGKANRMYAITLAGEAFLETWVEACEQYRRVTDTLSRVNRVGRQVLRRPTRSPPPPRFLGLFSHTSGSSPCS